MILYHDIFTPSLSLINDSHSTYAILLILYGFRTLVLQDVPITFLRFERCMDCPLILFSFAHSETLTFLFLSHIVYTRRPHAISSTYP